MYDQGYDRHRGAISGLTLTFICVRNLGSSRVHPGVLRSTGVILTDV